MYYKHETGKEGENIATKYLEQNGYEIIDRNFRCKAGEIDVIARNNGEYVFIEVKTRSNKNYGLASEAVNKQKQSHLLKTIKYYIYLNRLENKFIRIDVIEVYIRQNKAYINHIKHAIG